MLLKNYMNEIFHMEIYIVESLNNNTIIYQRSVETHIINPVKTETESKSKWKILSFIQGDHLPHLD